MSRLKLASYWILLIYVLFVPRICCTFQFSSEQHPHNRKGVNAAVSDLPNTPLDLEKRRVIAENYLKRLAAGKERRADLYDSTNIEQNGRQLDLSIETAIPIGIKPPLDSDYKPIFSDIKGEVIGSKTYSDMATITDYDRETVKVLSDFKQEICVLDSIYVTRWLKKLVLKIEKDANLESSSLSFSFNVDSLDRLKRMSVSKALDIGELDELICGLISTAEVVYHKDYDWSDLLASTINAIQVVGIVLAAILTLLLIYYCCVYHPVLTLLGFVVIITIVWHWVYLYKVKLAHKHAELSSMSHPSQCRRNDLGFIETVQEYAKSFFISTECKKYYEALMIEPIWEVSLGIAIAEALASVIFQPLGVAGRAVNTCTKEIYRDLSIIPSLAVTLFVFIFVLMFCKYTLKFPLLMGSLEPVMHPMGSNVQDLKLSKRLKEAIESSTSGTCMHVADKKQLLKHDNVEYSERRAICGQNNGNIFKSEEHRCFPTSINKKRKSTSSGNFLNLAKTCTKNYKGVHSPSSGSASGTKSTQVEAEQGLENQCCCSNATDLKNDTDELSLEIQNCEPLNVSLNYSSKSKCVSDCEESQCFSSGYVRNRFCNDMKGNISLDCNSKPNSMQSPLTHCKSRTTVITGSDNCSNVDCTEVTKSEQTSTGSL